MKNIKLDSVLLFALVIPFVMTYRIGPGETPYFLFGLIFLFLLFYLISDLFKIKEKLYFFLKKSLLWTIIILVLGSAFVSAIIVRHQTAPVYMIHDIILQQESAIRFFLDGKNPYAVTYFGTPLEQWNYSDKVINPALYHFVMQPFYLIFALPFYFFSNLFIGYFDGRIPLLFLFLMVLILAQRIVKDEEKKRLFVILLTFNPATLGYLLEGRSDFFMYGFLFLGFFLLQFKKYFMSAIPIALSFAVKQSVWPLFPFYIAFLYFKTKSVKTTVKSLLIFFLTLAFVIFPFFIWDKKAFLDSTVFYLSGNVEHGYPISGYGLGMVLYQMGVIKDLNASYPFIIWQLIIGIPLLIVLLRFLKNTPTVSRLILAYSIFLFAFWYLSRYMNNSHFAYLSTVFITAYFWEKE